MDKTRRSWKDFAWPNWVPQSIRDEVERFWDDSWGRGPDEWTRCARETYNHAPELGQRVQIALGGRTHAGEDVFVIGRYVHAWNNIGRAVDDTGRVHHVWTGKWFPAGAPCDPTPSNDSEPEIVQAEIRAAAFLACHLADNTACECYEESRRLAPHLELAARELELIARDLPYDVEEGTCSAH